MKRIVLLLMTFMILYGCSDEVAFNSPAVQGNKNYQLWRATYFDAVLAEDGRLIISAGGKIEELTFKLSSLQEGTYSLSETSDSRIDFLDADHISYSTIYLPTSERHPYPETGQVIITEYDGKTITGNFSFIAFSADGEHSVGFNEGVLYKVPMR